MQFIRARGVEIPSLIISPEEWAAVHAELLPASEQAQRELMDSYLRSKYY
jgi:hypothetical protein